MKEDLGPDVFKTGQLHTKREAKVRVPLTVNEERFKALNFKKDLTAYHCGDPVPWRSALGKKP